MTNNNSENSALNVKPDGPSVDKADTDAKQSEKPKTVKRKAAKRGHGRPFARLAQNTLESRMNKLQKRIDKSRHVLGNAEGYLQKYQREFDLRKETVVA